MVHRSRSRTRGAISPQPDHGPSTDCALGQVTAHVMEQGYCSMMSLSSLADQDSLIRELGLGRSSYPQKHYLALT